jgi:hypothetical protein
MRLKKDQIQKLSEVILAELKKKKLIVAKAGSETLIEKIRQVITADLEAEVQLDEEVRKLMEKYRAQISAGHMNEQQVFQMIKKQLVKERKLVI